MNKSSSLFQKTRWRLTSWYAGVISVLLTLLGIGVYEAIIHAHRITLEQELTVVAGTLHDNLQSVLIDPEKINKNIDFFLPNLCQVEQTCSRLNPTSNYRLNPLEQGQYYIQLFDLSGNLIAISGQQPQGIPQKKQQTWNIVKDNQGVRYLQISYLLHTQSDQDWGYLSVGRSLKNGDGSKIYRLLFNIVSNGIQYTLTGGRVRITLAQNSKYAVIIVEDTGIGIKKEDIKLIFNRFYRIDQARSRQQGGSGLGLSIAQAIANAHQGFIQVQSEINQGTRVIIQLKK
ncbi:MAG: sensor histidine kinase [Microcystaceae cyanobacterium]